MSVQNGVPDFTIAAGDTLPPLIADAATCGAAFPFAGWTVRFRMAGPVEVEGDAEPDADGVTGALRYDWVAGDTAHPGDYVATFVGTSPSGKQQTFGPLLIRVLPSA